MSNLNKHFGELLISGDGHVNTSAVATAAPRARGAGVRGGMPAGMPVPSAPPATNSQLAVLMAQERWGGKQNPDEQNLDPTGEKLAEALALATPVNVTYRGRKAANWVQPGFTEEQIEKNILSDDAIMETSAAVQAAYNEFKAEKAAMKPITNQSPDFKGRKKMDEMFYKFFMPTGIYSQIGKELFNRYDTYVKTGDQTGLTQMLAHLIKGGYPVPYATSLVQYTKRRYDELKEHYAYYNAKRSSGGSSGGKRKRTSGKRKSRRSHSRRRKMTRRK